MVQPINADQFPETNVRYGRICGRRAFGKRFLLVNAGWLIAGICSAYLGGVGIPLAIMRFAR